MGAKERGKRAGTDNTGNVNFRDIIGSKGDAAAAGSPSTTESLVAYLKQLVTDAIAGRLADNWHTVTKSDGAVLTGDDDIFVISGGPVRAQITGLVTTVLVGTSNGDLQIDVTIPSATVDLNAAPVAINADGKGTIYLCLDSTSIFTPVSAGAVIVDPVAAPEAYFILPVGTVIFRSSAAQTGVIEWTMTYQKLSTASLVVAA